MDYLSYFNLSQEPFSVMPVTKFYYHSEQHDHALQRLTYAVQTMKGLAVLVGDIGTGKTTLARRLLESLPDSEYEASLLVVVHADVDSHWLLKRIAQQIGVTDIPDNKVALLGKLYERLAGIAATGKKTVILIDEAQMLSRKELMEEFRGLLNLELPDQKLVSFVFFGLPELEDCLAMDQPLAQRVAVKYKLKPFKEETTADYIEYRLATAGNESAIFTEEALKSIHSFSRGIPRIVNVVCDNALFECYIQKRKSIDSDIIESVAGDLGLTHKS